MDTLASSSLLALLRADLLRQRELLTGQAAKPTLKLWIGILSPRFIPVFLCRLAGSFESMRIRPLAKLVALLNFFLFGIEISARCRIGPGLFFPHTQGTVIGAWSIGANATIFQGVTLGAREMDFQYLQSSRPVLGDDVTIGAGAKVLGGIAIGDGSRIGANAVVLHSIPPGVLAAGAPARVLKSLAEDE